MSADEAHPGPEELQFDRVDTGADASGVTAPTVACAVCGRSVGAEYYHVNGKPACENCRQVLISFTTTPRSIAPLLKAGLFGVGGAVAGAIAYYLVVKITGWELALLAIASGYMVGYMVRKGAGGRGGRRFQILAAILTYWSVGLAYTSLVFNEMSRANSKPSVTAQADSAQTRQSVPDSVRGADRPAVVDERSVDRAPATSPIVRAAKLLALSLALPMIVIAGSMPGGLLNALIILIGLAQAWSMTKPNVLDISGPYRVGAGPEPAAT